MNRVSPHSIRMAIPVPILCIYPFLQADAVRSEFAIR
jgi:hypothetical protein